MAINHIDHVTRGKDRVVTYFKTKEDFLYLLEVFLKELQEVEDALTELSHMKNLTNVTGVWLDYIGKIVGEPRLERTDEVYRTALKLKVSINTSDGTAPVIYDIIKTYTESDKIRIAEGVLSYGQLIFDGNKNATQTLHFLFEEIVPVTTKVILLQDTYKKCFFPAWETTTTVVDLFEAFDGSVSSTLDLVIKEYTTPTPLFVASSGQIGALDPDTVGREVLEWESIEEFFVSTGELFEVSLDGIGSEVLSVNGVSSQVKNDTLLPWEINELSYIITPDTPEDVVLYEEITQGGTLLIDVTSSGSPIYIIEGVENGNVVQLSPYVAEYVPDGTFAGTEVITVILTNEGRYIVNVKVIPEDVVLYETITEGNTLLVDVSASGSTIDTVEDGNDGEVVPLSPYIAEYTPDTEFVGTDLFSITLENSGKYIVNVEVESASGVVAFTGVQIGRAIITGESVWVDSEGVPTYDLLPQGTAFSGTTYPLLAVIYPSLITPVLPTETGSPHPYKIVADYTGGA